MIIDNSNIKRLHVNQHVIKKNVKTGERKATLTCKTGKENIKGHEIHILDENGNRIASVLDRMDNPLSCGARIYMQTNYAVEIVSNDGEIAVDSMDLCATLESYEGLVDRSDFVCL